MITLEQFRTLPGVDKVFLRTGQIVFKQGGLDCPIICPWHVSSGAQIKVLLKRQAPRKISFLLPPSNPAGAVLFATHSDKQDATAVISADGWYSLLPGEAAKQYYTRDPEVRNTFDFWGVSALQICLTNLVDTLTQKDIVTEILQFRCLGLQTEAVIAYLLTRAGRASRAEPTWAEIDFSRSELHSATGIGKATLSRVVNELTAQNLVMSPYTTQAHINMTAMRERLKAAKNTVLASWINH